MQFLVIGLGRFGKAVALTLASKGHEVLAIDKDESRVTEVEDKVSQALVIDSTNEKAMKSLGISDFDYVIVCMSSNMEASILTTMIVKDSGAKKVVAKAGTEVHAKILKRIGVDKVVFPEAEMGQRVAESLSSPKIFDYIELSEDYSIVEIVTPDVFVGKTLAEIDLRKKYGLQVIAIRRKVPHLNEDTGQVGYDTKVLLAPGPDQELLKGDILVVLGETPKIEQFKKL